MFTLHRCGVLPPHLFQRLSQSLHPQRASRATATLQADTRQRETRTALAERRTASTEPGRPDRTIHDAQHQHTLPGVVVREEGSQDVDDPSVNRAYDGLGSTYRLFKDVYGRDSLDGRGMPLLATVHYGHEYANAFWDGQQMVFGDGDDDLFRDFTLALDVLAHELTHGVIEHTTNFEYIGQPGALNESIADVFGVLVRQYHHQQAAEDANWLIGAELFTNEVDGAAIRSMKAPGTAHDDDILGKDPQPAHMAHYVDTVQDNGGVHINSGIPNHAFYQLAVKLGGYAWQKAGHIWLDTLTSADLKRDTDFATWAAATFETAQKRYGSRSAEADAVAAAWDAVGITPH